MKKRKIDLRELKVNSFVTQLEEKKQNTAKGGGGSSPYTVCCFDLPKTVSELPEFCYNTELWCA